MADGYKKKKTFQKKSPTRTTVFNEKFLIDLFSKRSRAPRAEPLVASAEAKSFLAVLFGTFSCGYIAKKKYKESFLNVACPNLFRSFFGKVGQRKNQRKAVGEISRLRARPRAARPWMGGRFLKKAT